MEIKLLATTESALEAFAGLFRWADVVDLSYAWAGAKRGKSAHWKALSLGKIGRALIGTQFAQTEPWVLETLQAADCELRVMLDSEGTFHPKLAIGRRSDGRVRILMGSSNLTVGGFGKNTELNVLLEVDGRNAQARKAIKFFEDCWARGTSIDFDSDWLPRYKMAYARRPKAMGAVPMAPWRLEEIASLAMNWHDYAEMINAQVGRQIGQDFRIAIRGGKPSYEFEFLGAAEAFSGGRSFASFSPADRKFVMGMGDSSGLLGNMSAAGEAKAIVFNHPEMLAPWLDRIPFHGDVSAVLPAVLEGMTSFDGINIGVASRLLVAKRPDVFVSVNNGSRSQLIRVYGKNIRIVSQYIEFLEAVWATEWFNSKRPDTQGQQFIWDHRAALLDAVLYEAV